MTWLRLDDQFHRHRKVAPLSDSAFRLHVTALLECSNQLTDGRLDCALVPTLPRAPQGKRLTDALRELEKSGLWHREGDVFVMHDFLDWNPPASDVLDKRATARERMKKAREEKARRRAEEQERKRTENTQSSSQIVRANETGTPREQSEKFAESSLNPVPVPVPVPNPHPHQDEAAEVPSQEPTRTGGKISCPPDLTLTEDQVLQLDRVGLTRAIIDSWTPILRARFVTDEPRTLERWRRSLSTAMSMDWQTKRAQMRAAAQPGEKSEDVPWTN